MKLDENSLSTSMHLAGTVNRSTRNGPDYTRPASKHPATLGRSKQEDEKRGRSSNVTSSATTSPGLSVLQFEPSLPEKFGRASSTGSTDATLSVVVSFDRTERRRTSNGSRTTSVGHSFRSNVSSSSPTGRDSGDADHRRHRHHHHKEKNEESSAAAAQIYSSRTSSAVLVLATEEEIGEEKQQQVSPVMPFKKTSVVRRNSFGGLIVDLYRKSSGRVAEPDVVTDHDMEYVDTTAVSRRASTGEGFKAKRRPSLKDLLFPKSSSLHEPEHGEKKNTVVAAFALKYLSDRNHHMQKAVNKERISSDADIPSDDESIASFANFPENDGFELSSMARQKVIRQGEQKNTVAERNHRHEKDSRSKRRGSVREHNKQPDEKPAASASKRTRRSSHHDRHRTHRSDHSTRTSKPRRSSEPTRDHRTSRADRAAASSSTRRNHGIDSTAVRQHMTQPHVCHAVVSKSTDQQHWCNTDCKSVEGDWWDQPEEFILSTATPTRGATTTTTCAHVPNGKYA